jgi:LmbE family N-acetylglucosaminyl deacetylase
MKTKNTSAVSTEKKPVFMKDLKVPSVSKVLVLAPHPDDFDAICITMRHLKDNGNEIHVAVISGASSGVQDSFCLNHPGQTKTEIREEEQRESCRFFGLPDERLEFLRLGEDKNGDPEDSMSNTDMIRKHIKKIRPDLVFMPHYNDSNQGHRRSFAMFERVAKELDRPVTAFLNMDPKTIQMKADIFTLFDAESAIWKSELLRRHASQHLRNLNTRNCGFDERILRENRKIAERFLNRSDAYAEAFEIIKIPSQFITA